MSMWGNSKYDSLNKSDDSWIDSGVGAHDIFSGVQDPAVRDPGVRPGERFSDTLIWRSEEAYIQERLCEERVAVGIPVDEEPAMNRTMEAEQSEFEEYDTESEDGEQMRENLTDARAGHAGDDHGSGDGRPVVFWRRTHTTF